MKLATVAASICLLLVAPGAHEPSNTVLQGAFPAPIQGREPSNTVLQGKKVDRFDAAKAFAFLRWQVSLGPRPAGSATSRRLAERLRDELPGGRFQPVPGGLQNVIGVVRGRDPSRLVVVGAHYDTEDLPGFLGANDGASGTAVVVQLARTLRPRTVRPSVAFILFDGEEDPPGSTSFEQYGLRGSKVAARAYARAEAAIVLDMIGDRELSIPRETLSDVRLWRRLRAAAARVGAAWAFPAQNRTPILDDHLPFIRAGVPAIDVIDFTFLCWHRTCDDMSAVSATSLDAVGETVVELLRAL
jgi:glutaminyl-peptide cyclotransferase